jgi:D-aminoacyl-tRNA deacylase
MIVLLQRVSRASVSAGGRELGRVGRGFLALICAEKGDAPDAPVRLAQKTAKLRVFEDDAGKMNRSVTDVGGDVLCVSQFTLAADTRSGNRPGFDRAAPPEEGRRAYGAYVAELRRLGFAAPVGEFGAHMEVSLVNDGPATFWLKL